MSYQFDIIESVQGNDTTWMVDVERSTKYYKPLFNLKGD